jgi:acylphosphatase
MSGQQAWSKQMCATDRTVHVRVTGRVQGVFYRAWTGQSARALGLAGWVRNRGDGSVEAVFSGSVEAVAAMMEKCRQGPPAARVEKVEILREGEAVLDLGEARGDCPAARDNVRNDCGEGNSVGRAFTIRPDT